MRLGSSRRSSNRRVHVPRPVSVSAPLSRTCPRPLSWTGTEDGNILKCSISYSEQHLEAYSGHRGPVYRLSYSPYAPHIFLSCSADWTVRIWNTEGDNRCAREPNPHTNPNPNPSLCASGTRRETTTRAGLALGGGGRAGLALSGGRPSARGPALGGRRPSVRDSSARSARAVGVQALARVLRPCMGP
jgi:hypothetical protein